MLVVSVHLTKSPLLCRRIEARASPLCALARWARIGWDLVAPVSPRCRTLGTVRIHADSACFTNSSETCWTSTVLRKLRTTRNVTALASPFICVVLQHLGIHSHKQVVVRDLLQPYRLCTHTKYRDACVKHTWVAVHCVNPIMPASMHSTS